MSAYWALESANASSRQRVGLICWQADGFVGDNLPKVTTVICGCDMKDGIPIYEKAKIILVQLGRFGKTNIDEIGDDYEKYLFLLKNMQRMIRLPERWQRPIFKKIFRVAEIAGLTDEERERYKQSVME